MYSHKPFKKIKKQKTQKKMQNTDNVVIPTLEDLQQRFHAVPRFCDPNRREYMWFKADDVARVFGYSDFSDEDLMYSINHGDRVCPGKKKYNINYSPGTNPHNEYVFIP